MKRLRILSGILLILLGRAIGVIVFEVLHVSNLQGHGISSLLQ